MSPGLGEVASAPVPLGKSDHDALFRFGSGLVDLLYVDEKESGKRIAA
ncbi:MAG: hypothetical protein AB8I08_12280 [Sandaracinaceae bacterium]